MKQKIIFSLITISSALFADGLDIEKLKIVLNISYDLFVYIRNNPEKKEFLRPIFRNIVSGKFSEVLEK